MQKRNLTLKPTVTFGKLTGKNILSFGSGGFEVDLSSHGMTLVEGANGHGKSTILEALTYCLFGKPYRKIKLGQLINSINGKALLTTLEFSCASDSYLIKRGQKPSVFEIYKNGELIPEDSAVGDYQKFLETKVLGFSYKTFKQARVIGSASYTQFMSLTTEQRRALIEDILDVNIYSKMGQKAKDEFSALKKSLDLVSSSLDQKKAELNRLERLLAEMQEAEDRKKNDLSREVEENAKKTEVQKEKLKILQNELDELCAQITELENLKSSVWKNTNELGNKTEAIKKFEKHLSFFDSNSVCPTCTQEIQTSHKEEIRERTNAEIQSEKKAAFGIFTSLKTQKAELKNLEEIANQVPGKNREISNVNSQLSSLAAEAQGLKRQMEASPDSQKVIDQIKEVQAENFKLVEKKAEIQEEFSYLQEIINMLKDTGIKACTIREYVPLINSLLNQYLSAFGLFVDFQLDENFDEKILSRHRDDFSYYSFSEGEKQRIDLSILFTWMEISKRKNSVACNILFFDETLDSSLDSDSIQNFLEMLRGKEDCNTFIISHRGADPMYFDRVLKVKKKSDGFSRLEEE